MIIAGVVFVVVSIISLGVGVSLARKYGRNERETHIRNDKYSRSTSVRETPMEITTLSTGQQKSIKYTIPEFRVKFNKMLEELVDINNNIIEINNTIDIIVDKLNRVTTDVNELMEQVNKTSKKGSITGRLAELNLEDLKMKQQILSDEHIELLQKKKELSNTYNRKSILYEHIKFALMMVARRRIKIPVTIDWVQ